jgi:hypothetical protein
MPNVSLTKTRRVVEIDVTIARSLIANSAAQFRPTSCLNDLYPSPADFEDLVRDLIGQQLRVRFESFSAGPDGGMDGRPPDLGALT